ncbi:MAG TPA: class I SAM-dependent methyltransferase [Chloroflexia bacterium]|nr:class I SAM-dependent methyltransferase [Chloroflexia bacterium]
MGNWVEEFYTRQYAWAPFLTGDVAPEHQARVEDLVRLAGAGPWRVLELGAGPGQTAAGLADAGHTVTAVELTGIAVEAAQRLASRPRRGRLQVVQGDFYTIDLPGPFDVVGYWDGFGIGSDEDQGRLLGRIAAWLAPGGCALIDINTPWYWARVAGQEMTFPDFGRRYHFDADGCRLLDTWWPTGDPGQAVTQSLRCYSPADLRLLLRGTGLTLADLEPGGAVTDYAAGHFEPHVPLGQAMSYRAKLTRD